MEHTNKYLFKYSRRRLIGSLWAMEKVIPITEWSHYPNSFSNELEQVLEMGLDKTT